MEQERNKLTASRLALCPLSSRRGNGSRTSSASLGLDFFDACFEFAEVSLDGIIGGVVSEKFGDALVVDLKKRRC